MSKEVSDELHLLVARHEAIESGHFRGQGSVSGGGHVRTSDGGRVAGIEHGEGGIELLRRHQRLLEYLQRLPDARMQALACFASAARTQYYVDGNKRTARLMTAGHLISSGYDAISVPNSRRLEFHTSLDVLVGRGDATPLMAFLASCTI